MSKTNTALTLTGTDTDACADDTEAAQGDVVPMDKAKPEDITAAEPESQQTEPKLPRNLLVRLFTKNQVKDLCRFHGIFAYFLKAYQNAQESQIWI